jgi:AcrR family transcriptional regulator
MVIGARQEGRRQEIVRAAVRVFATRGYHKAGVPDIARELGVGYGTLYRYYANKREILLRVVDETFALLAAVVAAEEPSAADTRAQYRAQVERIGSGLLRLVAEQPDMVRLTFVESLTIDPETTALVFDRIDAMTQVTAAYLGNGVAKGFLRADLDVSTTAKVINGAIWSGALAVSRSSEPGAEAQRWVRAISELLFEGVGGPLPN